MFNEFKLFMNETPAVLWFIAIFIGILLEKIFQNAQNYNAQKTRILNILHMLVCLVVIFFFGNMILKSINIFYTATNLKPFVDANNVKSDNIIPFVISTIAILLLSDFLFYWWHRASHYFEWLWDIHAIHHSDEHLTVLTAVRVHWLAFFMEIVITVTPAMFIWGASSIRVYIIGSIIAAWNFLTHTNLKLSLGAFSWVIVGPQQHRIHHSILPQHHDKNFAILFPIFDLIFGTYYHPDENEYPTTGVTNLKISTLWKLSYYPFMCWFRKILLVISDQKSYKYKKYSKIS